MSEVEVVEFGLIEGRWQNLVTVSTGVELVKGIPGSSAGKAPDENPGICPDLPRFWLKRVDFWRSHG